MLDLGRFGRRLASLLLVTIGASGCGEPEVVRVGFAEAGRLELDALTVSNGKMLYRSVERWVQVRLTMLDVDSDRCVGFRDLEATLDGRTMEVVGLGVDPASESTGCGWASFLAHGDGFFGGAGVVVVSDGEVTLEATIPTLATRRAASFQWNGDGVLRVDWEPASDLLGSDHSATVSARSGAEAWWWSEDEIDFEPAVLVVDAGAPPDGEAEVRASISNVPLEVASCPVDSCRATLSVQNLPAGPG